MNRQNFLRQAKVDIIRRATRPDGQPACERCGAIGVRLEVHHRVMDAMVLPEDKKRKLTAADGEAICQPCHLPVTSEQRKILAKTLAVEAKSVGASRPKGSIPSAPKAPRVQRELAHGVPEIARRVR